MRKLVSLVLSLLLLTLTSCGSFFDKPIYQIGIDPDFYSLELNGMEASVNAYCNELFQIIGKEEGMDISFIKTSWDILERGMKKGQYQAILSGRPEYIQKNNAFDHSSLFLATGPILVIDAGLKVTTLVDLKGKVVAFASGSKADLLLENHPDITIRSYPSYATALTSIAEGYSDAALIPNLFAQHYVHNLFNNSLKIVGKPLTDAGLRLITVSGKNQDLLNFVDNALGTLREKGKLQALQKKWNLAYN